ncbi:MAG: hypothetical protein Q7T82_21195 [Armatimonadota bacterium]|nr:hypothetical protein [Armatimonadota bacterium]
MSDNWSVVGWQGVSLRAPSDWNLVAVSGEENKGYFRVDSPSSSAVEVRWEAAKQAPDLDAKADIFLDALGKTARKKRISFSSRVKSRKPTPAEEKYGGDSVGFTWKSDRSAYGRMLYCGYCKRLVVGQVVSEPKQDLSGLSAAILGSICEHADPGWNTWGLYDLQVPVPESLGLKRHSLMSSFVELEFAGRGERLLVQRWGLAANTLLKKTSFADWLANSYLRGIEGYRVVAASVEDPHEALAFEGRRSLLKFLLSTISRLRGKSMPRSVTGRAWYCEDSNRIYAVRHYHRGDSGLDPVLRDKIKCH